MSYDYNLSSDFTNMRKWPDTDRAVNLGGRLGVTRVAEQRLLASPKSNVTSTAGQQNTQELVLPDTEAARKAYDVNVRGAALPSTRITGNTVTVIRNNGNDFPDRHGDNIPEYSNFSKRPSGGADEEFETSLFNDTNDEPEIVLKTGSLQFSKPEQRQEAVQTLNKTDPGQRQALELAKLLGIDIAKNPPIQEEAEDRKIVQEVQALYHKIKTKEMDLENVNSSSSDKKISKEMKKTLSNHATRLLTAKTSTAQKGLSFIGIFWAIVRVVGTVVYKWRTEKKANALVKEAMNHYFLGNYSQEYFDSITFVKKGADAAFKSKSPHNLVRIGVSNDNFSESRDGAIIRAEDLKVEHVQEKHVYKQNPLPSAHIRQSYRTAFKGILGEIGKNPENFHPNDDGLVSIGVPVLASRIPGYDYKKSLLHIFAEVERFDEIVAGVIQENPEYAPILQDMKFQITLYETPERADVLFSVFNSQFSNSPYTLDPDSQAEESSSELYFSCDEENSEQYFSCDEESVISSYTSGADSQIDDFELSANESELDDIRLSYDNIRLGNLSDEEEGTPMFDNHNFEGVMTPVDRPFKKDDSSGFDERFAQYKSTFEEENRRWQDLLQKVEDDRLNRDEKDKIAGQESKNGPPTLDEVMATMTPDEQKEFLKNAHNNLMQTRIY
jgi:hypothetical protein